MSEAQIPARPWKRPSLGLDGPQRGFANLNRLPGGPQPGLGGIPLTTAEDAVVAAVRLAYKVADTQITRSGNLAKRLQGAGDRAVGAQSEVKALDATERLVLRAVFAVLTWIEGLAPGADAGNPLKRLLTAEFRMLGSMLGLHLAPADPSPKHRKPDEPYAEPPRPRERPAPDTPVYLLGDCKRAVIVTRLVLSGSPPGRAPLAFYHSSQIGLRPLEGVLDRDDNAPNPVLRITTRQDAQPGLWKAAICIGDMQVGLIEIEL